MGDSFKRVQAGQKLAVSARAYNAMLDTAEAYQRSKLNGGSGVGSGGDSQIVLVKNSSGWDASRFDVLGISGVVFSPTDSAALTQFKNSIVLTGHTPSTNDHEGGRFVICAEPIPDGSIGRAWAYGVCQVQINATDEAHKFADVRDGDHTLLDSAEGGAVSILWKEAGTGTKWAVVRFGASGGGSSGSSGVEEAVVVTSLDEPDFTVGEGSEGYAGGGFYRVRKKSSVYAEWNPENTPYAKDAYVLYTGNNRVYKVIADPAVTNMALNPAENTAEYELYDEIKIEFVAGFDIEGSEVPIAQTFPIFPVGATIWIRSRKLEDDSTRYLLAHTLTPRGETEDAKAIWADGRLRIVY
ncbi:MAG: hypothetical protein WC496_02865 [Phycisphaerae bacterium]|jgi:hypothetical protein